MHIERAQKPSESALYSTHGIRILNQCKQLRIIPFQSVRLCKMKERKKEKMKSRHVLTNFYNSAWSMQKQCSPKSNIKKQKLNRVTS